MSLYIAYLYIILFSSLDCQIMQNVPLSSLSLHYFHSSKAHLHQLKAHSLKGIVLTSFLVCTEDPGALANERKKADSWRRSDPASYLGAFRDTAVFHNLTVYIFIDECLEKIVAEKYSTPTFRFIQTSRNPPLSSNDDRFLIYHLFLMELRDPLPQFVLFADISDVYFQSNPFDVMLDLSPQFNFFPSFERALLSTTPIMRRKECKPPESTTTMSPSWQVKNAGLWGATFDAAKIILLCMKHFFLDVFRDKSRAANCNMPIYNLCTFKASSMLRAYTGTGLFNVFGSSCDSKDFSVIHNHCDTIKKCLEIDYKTGASVRIKCNRSLVEDLLTKEAYDSV